MSLQNMPIVLHVQISSFYEVFSSCLSSHFKSVAPFQNAKAFLGVREGIAQELSPSEKKQLCIA